MSHSLFSAHPEHRRRPPFSPDSYVRTTFLIGLVLLLFGCRAPESGPEMAADSPSMPAPLLDNLGDHTMPITTTSAQAQRYFDQGLTLAYGFNHAEAGRSFRAASQLDSTCAMCAWGEALVLGPNINAPMDPNDNATAWTATQRALRLAQHPDVTDKEKALIRALSRRYAETPPEDRSALDRAYANAMRPVAEEHLYATAMWHYGQGLAQLDVRDAQAAREHLNALTSIAESEAGQALEQPFFYGLSQLNIARHLLQGRIAEEEGNETAMLEHLRTAVRLQDELPYMEPPYWYYPTRHTLGAALLRAGRHAEAEAVYREDLAHFAENGWALHGLAQSLRAQGRHSEAQAVSRRFKDAWTYADVTLAAGTPAPQ